MWKIFSFFSGRNSDGLRIRGPITILDAILPSEDDRIFEDKKPSLLKRVLANDVEMTLVLFLGNALAWIQTSGPARPMAALIHVIIFIATLGYAIWKLEKRPKEDSLKKMVTDIFESLGMK